MEKHPKIRFNGFSGDWQKSQLKKEIGYTSTGVRACDASLQGKYDLYDANEVIGRVNTCASESKYISIIKDGSGVGRVRLLPGYSNCLGTMGVITPKNGNDIDFILSHLLTKDFRRHIISGAIPHVYFKDYGEDDIVLPCPDEQRKLGCFFQTINDLVDEKQRKLDSLRQLKAAMLEQMFPCGEETAPRIRFKGFDEPWEYVTLSDISSVKTGPFGSALHADDYVPDGTPIITTEHFKSGRLPYSKKDIPQVSNQDYERLSVYSLKVGDLVFSRVGSVDINAHVYKAQEGWLFSGRVLRVRPNDGIYPLFLHSRLETVGVRKDIIDRAVGLTMASINTEILGVTKILITQNYEEQQKIGDFFKEQDELIDAAAKQITKLKRIRQALLNDMFAS